MKHAAGALTSDRQQQALLNAATAQGQSSAKPDGRNAIAAAFAGEGYAMCSFAPRLRSLAKEAFLPMFPP